MKNKNKQQKHVKQSNKTRLTQKKNKTLKLCKTKTRRERRSDRITWSLFPSTPWKNLSFEQTLEPVMRGKELKPFKFERNMRALRRSPRGARED